MENNKVGAPAGLDIGASFDADPPPGDGPYEYLFAWDREDEPVIPSRDPANEEINPRAEAFSKYISALIFHCLSHSGSLLMSMSFTRSSLPR